MNELIFTRLATLLQHAPVVLASVSHARGATPRKDGSRMLVTDSASEFSIGGGLAEARVIDAAQQLLQNQQDRMSLSIDLSGKAGAAGVCGGSMELHLRRWCGATDQLRAQQLSDTLRAGRQVRLLAADIGGSETQMAQPNARLLIVGAGHCGLALYDLAQFLQFDIWVYDQRASCFDHAQFAGATRLDGGVEQLALALDSEREVYAVLLNRDFATDVAALAVLSRKPPHFLGMMGSRKRIAEVSKSLASSGSALPALHAPIGLAIDAHTPHEIAISILAQLIQQRRWSEQGHAVTA